MDLSDNTILITGGATGIGLELARQLLDLGNEIIICGRREEKLSEAKKNFPRLHTYACDLSKRDERITFVNTVIADFPRLNILINNAGIQNQFDLTSEISSEDIENEIATNLIAPIHLSSLFISHLPGKNNSAIINVTSGLGFVPLAIVPVYCSTKAALHSYTMSLRHQLKETSIKVFEIAPPTVDTNLDRGAREKRGMVDRGISAVECAALMIKAIEEDRFFAPIGQAENLVGAVSSGKADLVFGRMNG